MKGDTHNQKLLTSLRDSIVDKPPYMSGTLQLPDPCFSIFYKIAKDGLAARFAPESPKSQIEECLFQADISCCRYINFANTTPDELEQLAQACEPASFGLKQELVLDETYRKARKLDSESFASMLNPSHTDLIKIIRGNLLEGLESTEGIKVELYKLNIYGKCLNFVKIVHPYLVSCYWLGEGSFFKSHVDTPRSENMFGSLVVVFPTPHEGGALFLRHHGHEWIFDSAQALAAVDQPTIGYVAFFSDIEHEVAPVTSGHRITLTYNLYFDDDGPLYKNDAVSEHLIPPKPPNQEGFCEAFKALLGNPKFMAGGGTLVFGLRHTYPIKNGLKHVYNALKGSDAVVYQSVRALGFEPVLHVFYSKHTPIDIAHGAIVEELIVFDDNYYEQTIFDIVQAKGGILVRQDGRKKLGKYDGYDSKDFEPVEWVTPLTQYNRQEGAFASYGNEPTMNWAYGDVCMVIRIGKANDRLAYPTTAQVKRAQEQRRNERDHVRNEESQYSLRPRH
jgi:hypothetical protein